jgi:hypothetical protein
MGEIPLWGPVVSWSSASANHGTLRDNVLFEKPFAEGEDEDLITWQVLL